VWCRLSIIGLKLLLGLFQRFYFVLFSFLPHSTIPLLGIRFSFGIVLCPVSKQILSVLTFISFWQTLCCRGPSSAFLVSSVPSDPQNFGLESYHQVRNPFFIRSLHGTYPYSVSIHPWFSPSFLTALSPSAIIFFSLTPPSLYRI